MNPNEGNFKGKKNLCYILRIDCNKAEKGLKNTAWTDHVLNALAIDNLLETCNPSDTDGFVLSQQRNTDIYRCRG